MRCYFVCAKERVERRFFVCISEEASSKAREKKIQLVLVDEPLSHVLVGGERKK